MQNEEPPDQFFEPMASGKGRILDISAVRGDWIERVQRYGSEVVQVGILKEHLPYEDESFDYVVALETLSHLGSRDQILATLSEARRVLRPGGRLFVTGRAVPEEIDRSTNGYAGDSGLEPAFTPETLSELTSEARFVEVLTPFVGDMDGRRGVIAIVQKPKNP